MGGGSIGAPSRLAALAEDLGLSDLSGSDAEWTAIAELSGCWPIPSPEVSFGKGSSCVVGQSIPISCAEVEFTLRARGQGRTGGWVNTYGEDRRIPSPWREAIISQAECVRLVAVEFPTIRLPASGFPDLVLTRDRAVVGAECKRSRGPYFDSDCQRKTFRGDTRRQSQDAWTATARRAGIPSDALLTIWWTRRDIAPCNGLH